MNQLFRPTFIATAALMALIVAVVAIAVKAAESRVEQAVRYNFTAAGLLARIQLQGERMRRYEKEMFIYAAATANRVKYVKEFEDAHTQLLTLLNEAAAPSSRAFNDAERQEMLGWVDATAFYAAEFAKIANGASALNTDGLPADQKALLTIRFNGDIKAGKDRFAAVLSGATKMREAKEVSSLNISGEIASVFRWLMGVIAAIAAAAVVAVGMLTRTAGKGKDMRQGVGGRFDPVS